jgi:hypothetical protein
VVLVVVLVLVVQLALMVVVWWWWCSKGTPSKAGYRRVLLIIPILWTCAVLGLASYAPP